MTDKIYIYLFYYFIVSYILRFFVVIASSSHHPKELGEQRVRSAVTAGSLLDVLHFVLAIVLFRENLHLIIPDFMFFGIDVEVEWNHLSLTFLGFSIIISSLMTRFSVIYLHRDPYYYKFFSILYIAQIGLSLLILTIKNESIFIGWELLGLSSILLIAFYEYRISVLKNSLRILVIYKISDVVLYIVLVYSASNGDVYYSAISNQAAVLGLLIACLIKSSIFPWFWLPRAMEGPTPSTAIFYGGLATHIPIFIFMNVWWNLNLQTFPFAIKVISVGIAMSAICASLLSRQINDVKNAISYAAITQLGIIYLEIIFGFFYLAIIHCIVHGIYRTTEFLKAPSVLYSRYTIEQNRRFVDPRKNSSSRLYLQSVKSWFYRLCYNEFFIQRAFIHLIDQFMGLSSSRINMRNFRFYVLYSLIIFCFINSVTFGFTVSQITFPEIGILALAYALNVLSLINKHNPKLCFIAMTLSVFANMTVLAARLLPILDMSVWFYLFITLLILFQTYILKALPQETPKFVGRIQKSSVFNMFVLVLGLSITGMPGLGTFFIWERLTHSLIQTDPAIVIGSFVLLALNTIAFFRFYYANFLGKYDSLEQFHTTYRI
jgi:NADH:ubiquinone oxidoreductase subunit 5 (subunit L)/multisubunit Na+/H+ antiporter MnhA subunit